MLKRWWKRLRRFLQVKGIELALFLVGKVPFFHAKRLGRALGSLAFYFLGRERRMGRRNLRLAFRNRLCRSEEDRILQEMFAHYGELVAENAHLPKLTPKERERLVVGVDSAKEKLLKLYRNYGRLILATAHLGNWELMGSIAAQYVPLAVVARRPFHPRLEEILWNFRKKLGMLPIDSRQGVREMLLKLRQGYALGVLLDHRVKRLPSVDVPFFGIPAPTVTGVVSLALAAKAPLVPAFAVRVGELHRFYLEDPIFPPKEGRREEKIYQVLLQWNQVLERYIRRYPSQWCWNHNRWDLPKS